MLPRIATLLVLALSPVLLASSLDMNRREAHGVQRSWRHLLQTNSDDAVVQADNNSVAWSPLENNTVTNVTAQLGTTAYLPCRVRTSGECANQPTEHVSWVRRRDWHILSSGMLTYTNDERFQILHPEGSDDWTLQIKFVQKRDDGTYGCQVSSCSGGLISYYVNLHIVQPEASIQGSAERHVDIGSIINLICTIDKSPTPPQYVFWYHNERMINYDTARGGLSVETRPGAPTQSRLTVQDAHDGDSGNYTCSASNTKSASIYIFVQEGDNMASLRRKTSLAVKCNSHVNFLILLAIILIFR